MDDMQKGCAGSHLPEQSDPAGLAMYRAAIETSKDGFFLADRKGRILEVNEAFVTYSGYTREELLLMRIPDFEARESADETLAHIEKVVRDGSDIFETLHRTKDGNTWPVEVNVSYQNINGGRFFNFLRDITARKQSEDALRIAEERLQFALEGAEDGVWDWNIQTGESFLSRQYKNIYGYADTDVFNGFEEWISLLHPEDKPQVLAGLNACLDGTVSDYVTEFRARCKDGRWKWVLGRGKVVSHTPEGRPLRMIGTITDITQRRQVEESLRQSEAKLSAYLDNISDTIWVIDQNLNMIYVTPSVKRMLGISPEELIGKHSSLIIHPDDMDVVTGAQRYVMEHSGEPHTVQYRVITKDGCWIHVESTGTNMLDNPAINGVLLVMRDITSRKLWEERLKKINAAILNLDESDHAGNLNALTALCGELLNADCALFNRLDGDLLCIRGQWSGPDDLKQEDAPQGHICFDVICRDNDGPLVVRNLQDTAYARTDPNVAAYGLRTYIGCRVRFGGISRGSLCVVFTRDYEPSSNDLDVISIIASAIAQEEERHVAVEKLRQSEEFVRLILDSVDEGFLVIDRDYRILTANRAFCGQVARPLDDIIGRPCFEISRNVSRPCYEEGEECPARAVFATGQPHNLIRKHLGPDDHVIYAEVKAFPVRDASGSIISVIETISDITEKRLLEEEQLKSQKLESIGTLAGGIAHDFNNLLQGVFGYISMAKMTLGQKEKSLAMLEKAEEALRMTVTLTTQLLTFSKGGKPSKKLIRLEPAIEQAVKVALSGSPAGYLLESAADVWTVEADESQLTQAIRNIVMNADEAMAGRGTVTISIRNMEIPSKVNPRLPEGGRFVRIDIQDTGTGIPEQNLAKIFDPYFTTKQKGSGLGLATAYSIIKNHGGMIEVSSELNRGTTFSLYLPMATGVEQKTRDTSAAAVPKKFRILLMDDEDLVRNVAEEMVAALGHDVVSAKEGEEAIELFRQARESGKPFDVVILDLTVKGGMGGEAAMQKILEIDPHAKAVVSSGYSGNHVVAHYRDYGFCASLNKPYKLDALSDCFNTCMQ